MTKHVAAAIALLATPVAIASGCANQSANNPSTGTTTTSGSASNAQQLTTQLNTADGKHVANATIDFTSGYATVTVETAEAGILSPGFHGLHIHAVGKCEGDFTSAGGTAVVVAPVVTVDVETEVETEVLVADSGLSTPHARRGSDEVSSMFAP